MFIKYRNQDLGLLILRLGLSLIFFAEAFNKFSNVAGTVKFFASLGLPFWTVYCVASVELIAAVVFLLGILPEWGYVIAIEMAVIIIRVRWPRGWQTGFFEFMILAAALTLALSGPGKYS